MVNKPPLIFATNQPNTTVTKQLAHFLLFALCVLATSAGSAQSYFEGFVTNITSPTDVGERHVLSNPLGPDETPPARAAKLMAELQLDYAVELKGSRPDDTFPEWGDSPYVALTISGTVRLQDLLTHLYVLIPVLDNEKHYWVGSDEIEKLLKRGEGWLGSHPDKDLIVSRYLKRQRNLTREALSRLLADDAQSDEEQGIAPIEREIAERAPSMHDQRLQAVVSILKATEAKRVLDLGCGEGKLLRLLLAEKQFEMILGMDVSWRSLEYARERLRLEELPERQRGRIELIQGSLTYRDQRLNGFDAAAIVEVIEHLDAARLATFERIVFEFARPGHIVLTTPNAEYNAVFGTLPAGEFRHGDHRFEWKRAQFASWASGVAERFGYEIRFEPLGPQDTERGAPTQMAIFSRKQAAA